MSKSLGNKNKAWVKTASTLTWLGGEQNNSLNLSAEAIEVSDKSSDWAQYISGKKGGTLDITVFADKDDEAQKAALDAFFAGDPVEWAVGEGTGDDGLSAPTAGFFGKGIVTAVGNTNDYGAVASRNISIQISGAVTPTNA